MRVVVYHARYGCDSGCCGHAIEVDGTFEQFVFDHPYKGDHLEFARQVVRDELGDDHVADLDWNNCLIVDD